MNRALHRGLRGEAQELRETKQLLSVSARHGQVLAEGGRYGRIEDHNNGDQQPDNKYRYAS